MSFILNAIQRSFEEDSEFREVHIEKSFKNDKQQEKKEKSITCFCNNSINTDNYQKLCSKG